MLFFVLPQRKHRVCIHLRGALPWLKGLLVLNWPGQDVSDLSADRAFPPKVPSVLLLLPSTELPISRECSYGIQTTTDYQTHQTNIKLQE